MDDVAKVAHGDAVIAAERDLFEARQEYAAGQEAFRKLKRDNLLARIFSVASLALCLLSFAGSLTGNDILRWGSLISWPLLISCFTILIINRRRWKQFARSLETRVETEQRYADVTAPS